jgi:hypothetical protein
VFDKAIFMLKKLRLYNLQISVFTGLITSFLLSWNLWISYQRSFPEVPALNFLKLALPWYADALMVGFFVLCAAFSVMRKNLVALSLAYFIAFVLVLEDVNRLQPWFYFYLLLIPGFTLKNKNQTEVWMIVLLSGVYCYSGLYKLNSWFSADFYPYFFSFFHKAGIPAWMPGIAEFSCGIFLLMKRTRFFAVILLSAMHFFILLVIGPAGKNINEVIWPWNLFMTVLLLNLPGITIGQSDLKKSVAILMLILLSWIMPAFYSIGYWPSNLSFNLYSGLENRGVFYFSEMDRKYIRAPESCLYYLPETTIEYVDVNQWCLMELNVPFNSDLVFFYNAGNVFCQEGVDVNQAGIRIKTFPFFTASEELTCGCSANQ